MANETNVTDATNATDSGAAPPIGGDGVPGLDVARRQLNRVMEMLQNRVQDMSKAMDGIGEALRNLGGGGADNAPGMLVDPETAMQAIDIAMEVFH